MRNLFSVSKVFDAREYRGNPTSAWSVDEKTTFRGVAIQKSDRNIPEDFEWTTEIQVGV